MTDVYRLSYDASGYVWRGTCVHTGDRLFVKMDVSITSEPLVLVLGQSLPEPIQVGKLGFEQRGCQILDWGEMDVEATTPHAAITEWLSLKHKAQVPFDLAPPVVQAGSYYQRIWRGSGPSPLTHYGKSYTQAVKSAENLFETAGRVFHTVEPDAGNDGCYGHQLRHLLILTCTEVEAAWRGVFAANSPGTQARSTTEYVRLLPVLRLDEYEVSLPWYPDYPTIRPFAGWQATAPTQSLVWYDAYNATKHDRETGFARATLRDALHALAGLYVMLVAQFGDLDGISLFGLEGSPTWTPAEQYAPPCALPGIHAQWTPVALPL